MSTATGDHGRDDEWRNRYLLCNHLVDPALASKRKRFEALSRYVRDQLADRWVKTRRAREAANPKRVYYLSMEYLIGRTLNNNILNLAAEPLVQEVMAREGWVLSTSSRRSRTRASATAASGGWRPASSTRWRRCSTRRSATACGTSTGSSASPSATATRSRSPTTGCASPTRGRSVAASVTPFGSARASSSKARRSASSRTGRPPSSASPTTGRSRAMGRRASTRCGSGRPRRPVLRFRRVLPGRLRRARSSRTCARSRSRRVLYPDDSTEAGRTLRFLQEYFLVSCSLQDIVMRFRQAGGPGWSALPDHVAIQLNDTHPVALGRRADAHPGRRGARRLGRGVGPDAPHASPTPTTRCCPRLSRSGR